MSLLLEVKSRLLLPGRYPDLEEELSPEEARDQLLFATLRIRKVQGSRAAAARSG